MMSAMVIVMIVVIVTGQISVPAIGLMDRPEQNGYLRKMTGIKAEDELQKVKKNDEIVQGCFKKINFGVLSFR